MNTKKFINLYVSVCLFPAWLFSQNIFLIDKLLYFLPYLLLYLGVIIYLSLGYEKKFKLFVLSIISTFALDQNLLFNQNFIKPNVTFFSKHLPNIYFADLLIILVVLIVISAVFLRLKIQSVKILFSFIFIIFIFKIYQVIENPIHIINFNQADKIKADNYSKKKVLFIILDEMSGIESTEKKFRYGDVFIKKINNFATKNGLNMYTEAYSISNNTANSVPFILNFETKEPTEILRKKFIKKAKSTYNEYDLIQNKLFEKFNNISVIQNVHLNFCDQKNVKKCYQINPYIYNKKYLEGFKNNIFTYFLSRWNLDGSSTARIFFKISRLLNFTDSILEPESHKIFMPLILSKIENDIKENKFDLIFAHILAPHIPYGFTKDCKYDGKKSSLNTKMKIEEKYIQHNLERVCMINFLDNFFDNLRRFKIYNNLDVFILSDHGSRITPKEDYSSIFLTRLNNSKFEITRDKTLLNTQLKKIFLKIHK